MPSERDGAPDDEDVDFFNSLLPDTPEPEPEAPAEPSASPGEGSVGEAEGDTPGEPARDERGRFVARERQSEQEIPPGSEQEIPPGEMIPPWRLREEAERRREEYAARVRAEQELVLLRRQLQQLEQQLPREPEEQPDVLVEPERFAQSIEQRIQTQFERRFVNASMGRAHRQYGDDFANAYRSLTQQDDYTRERILQADDPGEAMMDWHRAHSALVQLRTDPDGLRRQIAQELLDDPGFRKHAIETWRGQAAGQGNSRRPANVAGLPSLNRATSAKRDDASLTADDDAEFFRKTLRLQK